MESKTDKKAFTINDFEIDQEAKLGKGQFGNVMSVKEKRSGKQLALKVINIA
jgi:hypothetical protein